jgi:hypothetical protein
MSNVPKDPGKSAIDQQKVETERMEGQAGYGVEFEDGRYTSDNMQESPEGGRSGSYETHNSGGYGRVPPDQSTDEQASLPPDAEAQQGQGGQ